jgi:hypothetical protein
MVFITALLIACGDSGQGSAGGESSAGKVFGALPLPIADAATGDGVWNYSVASDYYYGFIKSGSQPSLLADFNSNNKLAGKMTYVFPVFGYIDKDVNNSYSSNTAQTNCYIGTSTPIPHPPLSIPVSPARTVFSYFALPQIKPGNIDITLTTLGDCVDGMQATSYYKNTIGIPRVVPVVEMSQGFNDAITMLNSTNSKSIDMGQLMNLAITIAKTILADNSVYGVAFDNEPAINKATSDRNNPVANCNGYDLEAAFYGTLAHTLATDSRGPKYLYLFDAAATANSLFRGSRSATGTNCTYSNTFPALPNIVIMPALYDLEDTTNKPASGPVDLSTFSNLLTNNVSSPLGNSGGPPVMFVLPASATSTMWTSAQSYNTTIQSSYTNPTSIDISGVCVDDATSNLSSINYQVLTQFMCTFQNKTLMCPTKYPPNPLTQYVSQFLNDCKSYTNTSVMNQYFTEALAAVNKATTKRQATLPRFIGNSLYAWRINAMNDISGATKYYSIYGDSTLYKTDTEVFPPQITPEAWTTYLNN